MRFICFGSLHIRQLQADVAPDAKLLKMVWLPRLRFDIVSDYLRRVSMWTELPPSGAGPILASLKCDYKAQLKYPDTVCIGTRVAKIGNSSFQMEHLVVSRELKTVAAIIDSTLVLFDYKQSKPVRIPATIRRVIGNLEGNSFGMPETV
jgi:acyl-CoA thioesterase FadM